MEALWNGVHNALGLNALELNSIQMGLRAIFVYVVTLVLVRACKKRFLGKNTAFDTVVAIILGSVVSRAITGNAPFFPMLVASAVIVAVHFTFAWIAVRSERFNGWITGYSQVLVENGEVCWDTMKKVHITEQDLRGGMRVAACTDDLSLIREARLERSGNISVVLYWSDPQVAELPLADGVQEVRIDLG